MCFIFNYVISFIKKIQLKKKWKLSQRGLLIKQLFDIFLPISLSLEELDLCKQNDSKQLVQFIKICLVITYTFKCRLKIF